MDIVERLEQLSKSGDFGHEDVLDDAISEIEKLRTALLPFAMAAPSDGPDHKVIYKANKWVPGARCIEPYFIHLADLRRAKDLVGDKFA
jgi:hypothetical protein